MKQPETKLDERFSDAELPKSADGAPSGLRGHLFAGRGRRRTTLAPAGPHVPKESGAIR
jgi:hypothetical protein